MNLKYSPEQISFGVKSVPVSTNTIYNWIYSGVINFSPKNLRTKGKRRRTRSCGNVLKRPDSSYYEDRTIHDRSELINNRMEFGHWEADTVLSGRETNVCLATFVERKTRQYIAIKMPKKDSRSMMLAIKKLIEKYPTGAVKSITCDRGVEFVHQFNIGILEDTFGTKIYYAHPYSPYERGSNENHNGLLREYYPKPTAFNKITQEHLDNSVNAINSRPRKTLNWKSANYRFSLELKKLNRKLALYNS